MCTWLVPSDSLPSATSALSQPVLRSAAPSRLLSGLPPFSLACVRVCVGVGVGVCVCVCVCVCVWVFSRDRLLPWRQSAESYAEWYRSVVVSNVHMYIVHCTYVWVSCSVLTHAGWWVRTAVGAGPASWWHRSVSYPPVLRTVSSVI